LIKNVDKEINKIIIPGEVGNWIVAYLVSEAISHIRWKKPKMQQDLTMSRVLVAKPVLD
jgi:hypothetical protein